MAKFISGTDASDSTKTVTINQDTVVKIFPNSDDQAVILYNDGSIVLQEVTIDNTLTEVLAMVDNLVAVEVFNYDKTSTLTTLLNADSFLSLFADSTDSIAMYEVFKSNKQAIKIDLTLAQLEALLEDSNYQSLTTAAASAIAATTATLNGSAFGYALNDVTVMGFAYNTSTAPVIADNDAPITTPVMGTFSKGITGLTTATLYYVRAYVIVDGSTVYGNEITFTTL